MKKLNNYVSIKKVGYAFYILTCGMDTDLRETLLEKKLTELPSDDEKVVFKNTVLYPFDSYLYFKLMSVKSNSYSDLVDELKIEGLELNEALIKDKFNEYAVNHFDELLSEFNVKIDNTMENGAKK